MITFVTEKSYMNLTVKDLRVELGYKGLGAFLSNWHSIHKEYGEIEDDNLLPDDDVCLFLQAMAVAQRGRSKQITQNAAQLLFKYNDCCAWYSTPEAEKPAQAALPAKEEQLHVQAKQIQPLLKGLSALDVSFAFIVLLADYGFVYLFYMLGLILAIVYTCIAIHARKMAGNRLAQQTAKNGIMAIVVLEVVAFFVHTAMFNTATWVAYNEGKLPFNIEEGWYHLPFVIALVVALLVSGAAIYSVTITHALVKERVRAENWEATNQGLKW